MSRHLVHGGALDEVMSLFPEAPRPWIDLSTGINPWPYPMTMPSPESFNHLPTGKAMAHCRTAMALYLGIDVKHLLLAPGSELLIRLLPTIINPQRVVLLSPSYGDHASVWEQVGCTMIKTDAPFDHLDKADVLVICNPNNPDGRRFDTDTLLTAGDSMAGRGGWLIVDEAYCDLEPARSMVSYAGREGLIILRSFGKFFGLAGVRLGAMLAPAQILAKVSERLGFWPVSGPALAIGEQAYGDDLWQEEARLRLQNQRAALDDIISASELTIAGGTDLFRYIECDNAAALWHQLAASGIYVRKFTWSDRHLRVGLPHDRDGLKRLKAALSL